MEEKKEEEILDNPEGEPKDPIDNTNKEKEHDDSVNKGLVEELKELRKKNGILTDLLDEKKGEEPETPPINTDPEEDKIVSVIERILSTKALSSAKANKEAALVKFVMENKEFHPENDPSGLKRDALQKKISQFNTEGLNSIDDFYSIITDAKRLLVSSDNKPELSMGKNPYSNPPAPKNSPTGNEDTGLTPLELKLAQQTGRSKESILKMKEKHPGLLDDLMQHVRE